MVQPGSTWFLMKPEHEQPYLRARGIDVHTSVGVMARPSCERARAQHAGQSTRWRKSIFTHVSRSARLCSCAMPSSFVSLSYLSLGFLRLGTTSCGYLFRKRKGERKKERKRERDSTYPVHARARAECQTACSHLQC